MASTFTWGLFVFAVASVHFRQGQSMDTTPRRKYVKPSLDRLHVEKLENGSWIGKPDYDDLTINIYPQSRSLQEPCKLNPCKNGGICLEKNGGQDYVCQCKMPFGGKLCGELSCGTSATCFRYQNTAFFIFPFVPSTFQQAKDYCVSVGMQLALLKNKDIHEAVRTKFFDLFRDRPEVKFAYWIGLYRDSPTSDWFWLDGSKLSYNGWADGRPGSSQCGNIANTKPFDFKFDDDTCDGYAGWRYFPLCQINIPV